MNNLILKSPQNWQTALCLPYVQITGTVSLAGSVLVLLLWNRVLCC